jgi:rfaE bifunctional protein nucleotidyltransferase chain/domain
MQNQGEEWRSFVRMAASSGVIDRDTLVSLREDWRAAGQRVVLTNGVFDLVHIGHVSYLQQARALGDLLIVGLNSDASTRALKGPERPLVGQHERAALLVALRCVDYVSIFEEQTAEALVAAVQPDVYVKGGDYALPDATTGETQGKTLPEAPIVQSYGGEVRLIPYLPGYSTSELIAKIRGS